MNLETARTEIFAKMSEKMNANPQRSASANIIMIGDVREHRRELIAEAIALSKDQLQKLDLPIPGTRHRRPSFA